MHIFIYVLSLYKFSQHMCTVPCVNPVYFTAYPTTNVTCAVHTHACHSQSSTGVITSMSHKFQHFSFQQNHHLLKYNKYFNIITCLQRTPSAIQCQANTPHDFNAPLFLFRPYRRIVVRFHQ